MGRLGQLSCSIAVICFLIAIQAGCSSSKAVNTTSFAVPTSVTLVPQSSVSIELGTFQSFVGTPQSANKTTISEPVFYQSSNSAVVTVAANGLVCAGSWDSLSVPQICSPGPVGFADITAAAQGVSSPPTRVYVHQRIDNIAITAVPPGPVNPCLSVDQTAAYQATAFSRGSDITSTVGQFTWQPLNTAIATVSTTANGLSNVVNGQSLNQVLITAKVPGLTPLFALIGNSNSAPFSFTTCPVQSIQLDVTAASASSKTITPTVVDSLGITITGVPLTWSSSESASAGVSNTGLASAVPGGGGATIIASCTPPACNSGLPAPIFPENVVTMVAQAGSSPSATVFVSSRGCGTVDACVSTIVPVTTPANTLGTTIILPATPNSMVFDRAGARAFIGTNSSLLGSKGLAMVPAGGGNPSLFAGVAGKILAISPNGTKVIVSDTTDSPNQVFVLDTATNAVNPFRITGATAADFSPDNLKAFIVAGSTLYIYSPQGALQSQPLTVPANDVTFLSEGAFAYLAGGSAGGITVRKTCDSGLADTVTVPGLAVPTFLKTLPGQASLLNADPNNPDPVDAFHVFALAPPLIGIISAHPAANTKWGGCPPTAVIDDNPLPISFDLGLGNFVASQLIISQDGSTAYIVTPNFKSILVFNIGAHTSSAIPLAGNGIPLQASLTPDGTQLYVGSSDGTLHILQTDTGTDVIQISFPQGLCQNSAGQPFPGLTCNPDFVAVKP
jgi:trimeric autotransporter adhesin